MTENEALLVATRLYVRMRASGGRVIDAVWMTQDAGYAREVLRLAGAHADPEVQRLAMRYAEITGAATPRAARIVEAPAAANGYNNRYVGLLR